MDYDNFGFEYDLLVNSFATLKYFLMANGAFVTVLVVAVLDRSGVEFAQNGLPR